MYGEPYFTKRADKEYKRWAENKSNQAILDKIDELIDDIMSNGLMCCIGKSERLRYFKVATYSRRITDEHRLVYQLYEESFIIISCYGHYDDK